MASAASLWACNFKFRCCCFCCVCLRLESYLPELLARIERQRKGLVPVLVLGSLLLLIVLAAVFRAALSARNQHRGPLCFLSNLGITFGQGCADPNVRRRGGMQAYLGGGMVSSPLDGSGIDCPPLLAPSSMYTERGRGWKEDCRPAGQATEDPRRG